MSTRSLTAPRTVAVDAAVTVDRLVKTYPSPDGGSFDAVAGVSFTVERGEIFGFLGPNGAGKTTTLEIVEGLTEPTSGSTAVLGLDSQRDRIALLERIGVQLQASSYFPHLRLHELLDLFGSFYAVRRDPDDLLDRVGLTGKRNALLASLSGGQAQRFSIVAALVNDPDVVFLDEPTTGLDPHARREVWELIESINRDEGKTIVLTTHSMEEAERLAGRVAIMDEGRIRAIDTPAGLISRLGTSPVIRFTCRPELDDGALRNLPGVTGLDRSSDGVVQLVAPDPNRVVPALFTLASVRTVDLRGLTVLAPTLEDVFCEITGNRLTGSTARSDR